MLKSSVLKETTSFNFDNSGQNNVIESKVQEAAKLFSTFLETNNYDLIKRSAKLFLEIIQQKPTIIDSYIYMAAIFFTFEQYDDTESYIRIAEKIDTNNQLLIELKNYIGKKSILS